MNYSTLEGAPPREDEKSMIISYIITLIVIAILLIGAVRLHMYFGLYHGIKAKIKTNVDLPHVERTPHLHDLIFSKY